MGLRSIRTSKKLEVRSISGSQNQARRLVEHHLRALHFSRCAVLTFVRFLCLQRESLFVTSKLWNTDHDPVDVEPALRRSLQHLGLSYLDLYLIHWPVCFLHSTNE